MLEGFKFNLELKVRDYECDLQGVVNNAVYHNYLEHARHELLKEAGIDFARLAAEGVNLVLTRSEVDYKSPLRSGDRFVVASAVGKASPLRYQFNQNIYALPDKRLIVSAQMTGVAVNQAGRPIKAPSFLAALDAAR